MLENLIYSQSYTFWIIAILLIFVVFWIFAGGEKQEFVGLKPLQANQRIAPYLTNYERECYARTSEGLWYDNKEKWEYDCDGLNEEEPIDSTPDLPQGFEQRIVPIVKPRQYESRGERQCRLVMEMMYGKPFPKVRPQFLRNPETGRLLELDCYCEDMGLAVEYNGIQHYVWPNYTNQTYDNFINQCRRDQLKVDLCDLNNVYLITVPYNVPVEQIEDYIIYYLPENVQNRLMEEISIANQR